MIEQAKRILPLRKTKDKWWILTIHYSSVPGYDYEAATAGMSEETIRQELEIDWSTTKGKRVYPEFGRRHHIALDNIGFNPRAPLYCGWDWGIGGSLAFVPTQLNGFGQWLIFPPVSPGEESTIGVYEFGQIVSDHLQRYYAAPFGLTVKQLRTVHFGDPAGAGPPPRTGDSPKEVRSCFQIIERGLELAAGVDEQGRPITIRRPGFGWHIKPGAVNITDRLEAIRNRLKLTLHDGLPALVVDPRAQITIEGFLGGYHYPQRRDGHYESRPEKNIYSHVMDALGYVATRLFAHNAPDDEDDSPSYRNEFASHAASRYEYLRER